MTRLQIVVPWEDGIHMRRAAVLTRLAHRFKSSLRLRKGQVTADLRSILSIVTLCATMGTTLEVEAAGDDEQEAARAVECVFNDGALR